MKRYKNGRFKSKRDYEIECKTRNYTLMITFLIVTAFSIALHPWTGTYTNITETKTANAQEIIQEVEEPASTEPVYTDKVQQAINDIPHTSSTTELWISYLYTQAEKAGKDADLIAHSIFCESGFNNVQSGFVKNNIREDSWGVSQIHLPSHPNITREQALNPYWAIDWKIENWENERWFGFSRSTDSCNNTTPEYWK